MGIPLEQLNDRQISLIDSRDRKPLKRRGMTAAEKRDKHCKTLERKIHDQFSGFANRYGFIVWHTVEGLSRSPNFLNLQGFRRRHCAGGLLKGRSQAG